MTDPHQTIAEYEQRTAALLDRAEEAKARIQELTGTATSQDGAVKVTVGASGALLDLTFGARADEMPKDRLAALVMTTAKRAQAQAVSQIAVIMAPVVGDDSDAMRFVREQIPDIDVPDEPEPEQETSRLAVLNEDDQDQPPTQPEPPRRPARPTSDDDTDFDQQDFLKRDGDR
ncbi:hypothetical protein ALI144C_22365 [Actinosynnema sp. ALI-1.44]|uniref:YbaB/EbfC family nucleoid-associated protein n=1 Tax=Actinosynnema sp. ALI-1.44 TaxID=1933779 RepID=UPI00097CB8E4|nr:YbaB/EbfC family nucleoid-associated protein [Actinosynnema sp. ALI-1.44]ONI81271.1 hypothetical protein ALI144C_22365 [Actinosynnema sp. ALI-1.44]